MRGVREGWLGESTTGRRGWGSEEFLVWFSVPHPGVFLVDLHEYVLGQSEEGNI